MNFLQSRDNRDFLQLICQSLSSTQDYRTFCLVCKLWKDVGETSKYDMANKFKLYCYKQTAHRYNGKAYLQLVEYYYLYDERLHGPWKLTLIPEDDYDKSKQLIRYVYSFGKLIYMASQEQINALFIEMGLERPLLEGN